MLLNALAVEVVGLSQEGVEAAGKVHLRAGVAAARLPRPQSVSLCKAYIKSHPLPTCNTWYKDWIQCSLRALSATSASKGYDEIELTLRTQKT